MIESEVFEPKFGWCTVEFLMSGRVVFSGGAIFFDNKWEVQIKGWGVRNYIANMAGGAFKKG